VSDGSLAWRRERHEQSHRQRKDTSHARTRAFPIPTELFRLGVHVNKLAV
jgi:hypothetical protein